MLLYQLLKKVGLWILFLCLIFSFTCAKKQAGFHLVKAGKCPYAIVLSDDASPSENYAAKALQKDLKLAMDNELPIVEEKDPRAQKPMKFVIGSGKLTEQLLSSGKPVDWKKLGDEGFIIRTVAVNDTQPDIVIAGGKLRGTMYGVFTFLDKLGFRWYTSRKAWLPRDPKLTVSFMDEEIIPPFMYREPYITEAQDPDWAVRNRVNLGHAFSLDNQHGGSMRIMGGHTFGMLIPNTLFKQHPDYFPLIGGKRVTGYVQRCLTNKGVVEVAAKNMIAWMNREPEAKIFSLAQEDTEMLCECPDCKKVMEEEGSPAGLYVKFVNEVAEIVEKVHPDKYIITFAYWFTEKPPKTVKPRNNVIIRLCPISICVAHPFPECTDSTSIRFYGHLQGWSKLSDRTFIWHYNTDFNNLLMPFPNFREFAPDIKNYYDNGVKGIFFQGTAYGPGGSDSDLRSWVMARLLWDPNQDLDELVNEWMEGVYGKAAKPMRKYFDLMHEQVAAADKHLHVFDRVTKDMWPDDVVEKMDKLHDEALSIEKKNSTAVYYIMKNRMAVMFLKYILNTGTLQVVDKEYRPVGNKVTLDDYKKFIDYIKQFAVTGLSENAFDSDLITRLRQRVETYPLVSIENNDVKIDVAPGIGGRIVSLIHKKSGVNLTNMLDPTENFYPVTGGYEEMTTRTWGCTGFANDYKAEVKGRELKLTAKTPNGLLFSRTISLPENGAKINFASSINNDSKKPGTFQLVCRMHLTADPAQVALKARKQDGSFIVPTATEEKGTFPDKNYRYDGPNKPVGAWRLENIAPNLSIENQFDEKEVDTCVMKTGGKDKMALMEIRSAVREVPAGGKITINHSWEIK